MSESLNYNLRYGQKLHTDVLAALMARYRKSKSDRATKIKAFNNAENRFQAYLPEKEDTAIRKSLQDQGEQIYVDVNIPYSYAILLSAHTYWTSVLLGRSPVFQYTARHGEPQMRVQAVEALMDYQVLVGRMMTPFYIFLHDAGKYGEGVIWNYWEREEVTVSRIIEKPVSYLGFEVSGKTRKTKETVQIPGYVGNKAFNVRPQDFFPDTRVTLANLQHGEFVARKTSAGWHELAGEPDQRYINLEVVKRTLKSTGRTQLPEESGALMELAESNFPTTCSYDIKDIGFVPLIEMYVRLIPEDWGLGKGTRPEMWAFTIADERVVIEARPVGHLHDKFPAFVLQYEIEGYNLATRGMLELLDPLSKTLDWLVNTHFFNVRSSMNNQFVVDPAKVVLSDLKRGGPSRLIRLKEGAYGTDIRQAIHQLDVKDVTQGHLRDSQIISEMMQRVSGVTDNVMGMVNAGGRKTATEVRTSSTFGINRLKTTAEWWSAGDWSLMAQVMLQQTQQYYDLEREFKIAGDLLPDSEQFRKVSPDDIQGFFDFVPVDGTMPIDRYAQANLWREILMGMQKIPQVANEYDVSSIFAWMAQLAGLKNIKQFRVRAIPDQMAAQQAAAGNLIPMGGGHGRRNAGPAEDQGGSARVPEPGQVSGMGQTS